MASSKYDAATLAPLVASSHSLSDVIRKLGLKPNGGLHRMFSALVRRYGLDTSHFSWGKLRSAIESVPTELLATIVRESTSFAHVLTKLDLPTQGRTHRELTRRVRALGLDTSHFTGRGWSRGRTVETHASVARVTRLRTRPDSEVFVENSPEIRGEALRRRLLARGWTYACAICGISEWQGKRLSLQLDHINGINNDNRLLKVRLLCPNWHSQTPTYCRRPVKSSSACEPRTLYTCYTSSRPRACWNW